MQNNFDPMTQRSYYTSPVEDLALFLKDQTLYLLTMTSSEAPCCIESSKNALLSLLQSAKRPTTHTHPGGKAECGCPLSDCTVPTLPTVHCKRKTAGSMYLDFPLLMNVSQNIRLNV